MGLLKKKKDKKVEIHADEEINLTTDYTDVKSKVLERGTRSIKDLFAPSAIDRSDENCLVVGNKFTRSFVVNGYPSNISVLWLNDLYDYDGDMDVALHIEPADERSALDELTAKITQFEAQLNTEIQKGNNRDITKLRNTVTMLYSEREKLEQNYENLFHIQIATNLYANSKDDLDKRTQLLDNRLKGRKINLMPLYLRQDDGYKTVLPFAKTYIPDMFRNFNSGALTACFPFYNAEISHKNGVLIGVNHMTATPVYIDFYDRHILDNGNLTVIGTSGSGKTFFVSLLTMRSTLKGIRTCIIDPENEYQKLTKALGGSYICLSPDPNAAQCINPFDIEEEDVLDANDMPTGEKTVRITDKVADIINLIGVMGGGLSKEQTGLVSDVILALYQKRGFNEKSSSLYENGTVYDEKTGTFFHDQIKKAMPTFTEFHNDLMEKAQEESNKELERLGNALKMFRKEGVYGMFDCQTSEDLKNYNNSPIITFDVSKLEDGVLRPIGMYIALTWTWEKFCKKNLGIKKRVVCDEAWQLTSKSMQGHEYTSAFLEKASRRIRKRNAGLLVASQNFTEFASSEQGKAVLTNATVNIFLKQKSNDIDLLQKTFKLSDGEKSFLLTAQKGDMLIKIGEESSIAHAMPFAYEKALIEKNHMTAADKQK